MKNFTPLDYEELNLFEEELATTLEEKRIKSSYQSPSEESINFILNYSKSLQVKPSKHLEYFEQILN
ncbi:MAG: hypothetical protein Kow0079_09830 [Vicingaceae bacterium]|jgi:hypothetical protein